MSIHWPPRSPDFNPMDFFFRRHLKSLVYEFPRDAVEDLTLRIVISADIASRLDLFERPTASSTAIQAQVAHSLGEPVPSRTLRRHLTEGHLGSRRTLRVLPLTPTHRRIRLEWCRARGNWTAAEWNQVVFSDESRFNLSTDDDHVCVWKPRGERLNSAFALQQLTPPTTDVMVWGVIAYNIRSPLEFISGTMTA
ncbi:transposable element Tcb2 transposase [Trichonephila clavipes]|nr:transposable element Tcb2 transposase [Trichonephila clavipes]